MSKLEHNRILRAAESVGHGTRYGLGRGGFDPKSRVPWDSSHRCDCSGFVAWCCGVSRDRRGTWWTRLLRWQRSPWFESSNIVKDAKAGGGVFALLDRPQPGAILAYGDSNGHQGHVALCVSGTRWSDCEIIDCASHGAREAITRRSGSWLQARGAIACTFKEDFK